MTIQEVKGVLSTVNIVQWEGGELILFKASDGLIWLSWAIQGKISDPTVLHVPALVAPIPDHRAEKRDNSD